jgi:uncharacterized membrane protein YdjX (TVP38/TMEM64 family)
VSSILEWLTQAASDQPLTAALAFICLRASAIIVPPIQGLPIDLLGIRLFGWKVGFLYAETGIMAGAMTCFYVARLNKRRVDLLLARRGIDVDELLGRLSFAPTFSRLLLVRLLGNPVFDPVSYAAGLTSVSSSSFFWATLVGNIPSVFLVFWLGDYVASELPWLFRIAFGGLVILGVARWVFRGRRQRK